VSGLLSYKFLAMWAFMWFHPFQQANDSPNSFQTSHIDAPKFQPIPELTL
jgi:hypothetical protein